MLRPVRCRALLSWMSGAGLPLCQRPSLQVLVDKGPSDAVKAAEAALLHDANEPVRLRGHGSAIFMLCDSFLPFETLSFPPERRKSQSSHIFECVIDLIMQLICFLQLGQVFQPGEIF